MRKTIDMKPSQVNESNEILVMDRFKKTKAMKIDAPKPAKFRTGDRVRMSKHKMTFSTRYTSN